MSLAETLQKRAQDRLLKEKAMREQAVTLGSNLQKKADAKRKEQVELEQRRIQEENLKILREAERQRLLKESRTKSYFELNKFNRKVACKDEPVYYGDMVHVGTAWMPHGTGEFSLNDEVKMEGVYRKGQFVCGTIHFESGKSWTGHMHDDMMHGVGVITQHQLEPIDYGSDDDIYEIANNNSRSASRKNSVTGTRPEYRVIVSDDDVQRAAIAYKNNIMCYQDELIVGMQVEFHGPVQNVYSSQLTSRNPIAVIIEKKKEWKCVCRFDDDVTPKERLIDFATIPQFKLLTHRPLIYNLTSFGIAAETKKVYDYRTQLDSFSVTAPIENSREASVQRQINARAMKLGLIKESTDFFDDISICSDIPSAINSVNNSAMNTVSNTVNNSANNSFYISKSPKSGKSLSRGVSFSTVKTSFTNYTETTQVSHNTTSALDKQSKYYNTRLLTQFPKRLASTARRNMFESRMVGIGSAQEEEEAERMAEIKKKQWAALIADKRAAQEAARQREIKEQADANLQASLALQKKAGEQKRLEDEEFAVQTKLAIDAELNRLAR